jgi:N6-L-threonylcarbamoyladenine synthase
MLGLPYPGGPALAALAGQGQAGRFQFSRPMCDRPGLDFSFSGLKTQVLLAYRGHEHDQQAKADIALAFQEAVAETLTIKCRRALKQTGARTLVVAGGVGANVRLRELLRQASEREGFRLAFPRPEFCTDNGAMIAYAGALRLAAGQHEPATIHVAPRWDLASLPAL